MASLQTFHFPMPKAFDQPQPDVKTRAAEGNSLQLDTPASNPTASNRIVGFVTSAFQWMLPAAVSNQPDIKTRAAEINSSSKGSGAAVASSQASIDVKHVDKRILQAVSLLHNPMIGQTTRQPPGGLKLSSGPVSLQNAAAIVAPRIDLEPLPIARAAAGPVAPARDGDRNYGAVEAVRQQKGIVISPPPPTFKKGGIRELIYNNFAERLVESSEHYSNWMRSINDILEMAVPVIQATKDGDYDEQYAIFARKTDVFTSLTLELTISACKDKCIEKVKNSIISKVIKTYESDMSIKLSEVEIKELTYLLHLTLKLSDSVAANLERFDENSFETNIFAWSVEKVVVRDILNEVLTLIAYKSK